MNLNKRFKICITLFVLALIVALSALGGAVLLALGKNYSPAFVLGALSLVSFYCIPFYYKGAADSRAFERIASALEEDAMSFETLSEKTGIRADALKKLFAKALEKGVIEDYEEKDGEILKKNKP